MLHDCLATGRVRRLLAMLAVLASSLPIPLSASGQDPRIELAPELIIGESPSGPNYELSRPGQAAVTRSGTVFLVDNINVPIRRFDAAGRYLGEVGRVGSGPGEYRIIDGMALLGDSLLVVHDPSNARLVLFDTLGTYRRTIRTSGRGLNDGRDLVVFADGTIAVRSRTGDTPAPGATSVSSVYVHMRANGEILDSIAVPPKDLGLLFVGPDGPRTAFNPTTVFALLPRGGIATAPTTTYRINVMPARGAPLVIERPAQPIALEGEEREEWLALTRFMRQQVPTAPAPSIPREKPIIRDLSADADGRIWVSLYTRAIRREAPAAQPGRVPQFTWWEPNAYDLFDERGNYLGRLELPLRSRLLATAGQQVWIGQLNEQDEPILVRYRMRMPSVR